MGAVAAQVFFVYDVSGCRRIALMFSVAAYKASRWAIRLALLFPEQEI